MTDLTTLKSLRDRVAKATGPDREIDYAIYTYSTGLWRTDDFPAVTSSIDAALAWVEHVLPKCDGWGPNEPASSGWRIGFYRGLTPNCGWTAYVRQHAQDALEADAPTPAIAIILAGLDALIAKEKTDG
jgi:hypothetical protein